MSPSVSPALTIRRLTGLRMAHTLRSLQSMSERIDELKGNVKTGAGKITGDRDLEAEGRAERNTARAKREVKGVGNQVKGSVEEGLGKMTGDEESRARGAADRIKGKSQRTG